MGASLHDRFIPIMQQQCNIRENDSKDFGAQLSLVVSLYLYLLTYRCYIHMHIFYMYMQIYIYICTRAYICACTDID